MEPLNQLTKESILEEKVFAEIFDQEDEVYKTRLTMSLLDRAEELGVKTKFSQLLNAYKRAERASMKKKKESLFFWNRRIFYINIYIKVNNNKRWC